MRDTRGQEDAPRSVASLRLPLRGRCKRRQSALQRNRQQRDPSPRVHRKRARPRRHTAPTQKSLRAELHVRARRTRGARSCASALRRACARSPTQPSLPLMPINSAQVGARSTRRRTQHSVGARPPGDGCGCGCGCGAHLRGSFAPGMSPDAQTRPSPAAPAPALTAARAGSRGAAPDQTADLRVCAAVRAPQGAALAVLVQPLRLAWRDRSAGRTSGRNRRASCERGRRKWNETVTTSPRSAPAS